MHSVWRGSWRWRRRCKYIPFLTHSSLRNDSRSYQRRTTISCLEETLTYSDHSSRTMARIQRRAARVVDMRRALQASWWSRPSSPMKTQAPSQLAPLVPVIQLRHVPVLRQQSRRLPQQPLLSSDTASQLVAVVPVTPLRGEGGLFRLAFQSLTTWKINSKRLISPSLSATFRAQGLATGVASTAH